MRAIDVGTTQLAVLGTHAQPYFVGSNRTCRSESRNFKRTSHEASSGRHLTNLSSAPASVSGGARKIISVLTAIALAQERYKHLFPELRQQTVQLIDKEVKIPKKKM
jgi:hypothetical protein